MRKFLSLVLAMVMTLSLITVQIPASASAKAFTDADEITYKEAIDVISGLSIVGGYAEGDFKPTGTLTRGAAAKIISNLILGPASASLQRADTAPFSDVPTDHVFAGYIAYCSKSGLISGYADGTFRPANPLTGNAFLKMLLCALGYDQHIEGYVGDNWTGSVIKQAVMCGLLDGVEGGTDAFSGTKAVTREEACLYALNTLVSTLVTYDVQVTGVNNGNLTFGSSQAKPVTGDNQNQMTGIRNDGNVWKVNYETNTKGRDEFVQFAEQYFPELTLESTSDDFMRPAHRWRYKKIEVGTYIDWVDLQAEYTTAVTGRDLFNTIGANIVNNVSRFEYYWNGDDANQYVRLSDISRNNNNNLRETDNGVLTQIFWDRSSNTLTMTSIDTWLAQTTMSYSSSREYSTVKVFYALDSNKGIVTRTKNVDLEDVPETVNMKVDEYYLVNISFKENPTSGKIVSIAHPDIMEDNTVTKWSQKDDKVIDKLTFGGEEYNASHRAYYDSDQLDEYDHQLLTDYSYNVYLDEYGYVIGVDLYEGIKNYLFVTGFDRNTSNITVKTATAAAIFMDGKMEEIQVNVTDTNTNINSVNNSTDSKDVDKQGFYVDWTTLAQQNNKANGTDGQWNHNRWYQYTVNDKGIYTLKPVPMTITYYKDKTTINTGNVSLRDNVGSGNVTYMNALMSASTLKKIGTQERAYGEDNSVYITAVLDEVDTTPNSQKWAITDVDTRYTGVQGAKIEIPTLTAAMANNVEGQVFAVYGKNNYVIGAIVLGETSNTSSRTIYTLSGAKNESRSNNTYYWDFDAIVDGRIQTLTAKSKYSDTIRNMLKANQVYKAHVDTDGYVTRVEDFDAKKIYDEKDAMQFSVADHDGRVINGVAQAGAEIYQIDYTDYNNNHTLTLQGRTLYITRDRDDFGLAIASNAKAITIQTENGKNNVKTEHDSVSAALERLVDANTSYSGLQFNGKIIAALSGDAASWVLFVSNTALNTGNTNNTVTTDTSAAAVRVNESTNTIAYYVGDGASNAAEKIVNRLSALGYDSSNINVNIVDNTINSVRATKNRITRTFSLAPFGLHTVTVDGVSRNNVESTVLNPTAANWVNFVYRVPVTGLKAGTQYIITTPAKTDSTVTPNSTTWNVDLTTGGENYNNKVVVDTAQAVRVKVSDGISFDNYGNTFEIVTASGNEGIFIKRVSNTASNGWYTVGYANGAAKLTLSGTGYVASQSGFDFTVEMEKTALANQLSSAWGNKAAAANVTLTISSDINPDARAEALKDAAKESFKDITVENGTGDAKKTYAAEIKSITDIKDEADGTKTCTVNFVLKELDGSALKDFDGATDNSIKNVKWQTSGATESPVAPMA